MSFYVYLNMEKIIKYKRFTEFVNDEGLREFLDMLVIEGWEIIYYSEKPDQNKLYVVALCCKKQNNVL